MVNFERKTIDVLGGCTTCPESKSHYFTIYVSDGSLYDVTFDKEVQTCMKCDNNASDTNSVPNLKAIIINKSRHTCIIQEELFQISTGEWMGKRTVLLGKYKGQKMIDVRKYWAEKG